MVAGVGSRRASRRATERREAKAALKEEAEQKKAEIAKAFTSTRKAPPSQNARTTIIKEWAELVVEVVRVRWRVLLGVGVVVTVLGRVVDTSRNAFTTTWGGYSSELSEEWFTQTNNYYREDAGVDREWGMDVDLLMVMGDYKSGATYVRQVLLDNLFVAPLDTHEHDHHAEPAMREKRLQLGIHGSETFDRTDASTLEEVAKKVQNTLFVLVVKDPIAWLASSSARPHHKDAAVSSSKTTKKRREFLEMSDFPKLQQLIQRRGKSTRAFLDLGQQVTPAFQIVRYEDALGDPERLVRTFAEKYGLHRRRGGDLARPQYHTGDVASDQEVVFHGEARRARYATSGHFDRRTYYLERRYLDDVDDALLKSLKRLLDPTLEARLGYQKAQHDDRPSRRRQKKKKKKTSFLALFASLASFLESLVLSCLSLAALVVLGLAPFIAYRLQGFDDHTVPPPSPQSKSRREHKTGGGAPKSSRAEITPAVSKQPAAPTAPKQQPAAAPIGVHAPKQQPAAPIGVPAPSRPAAPSVRSSPVPSAVVPPQPATTAPPPRPRPDPSSAFFDMWGADLPLRPRDTSHFHDDASSSSSSDDDLNFDFTTTTDLDDDDE